MFWSICMSFISVGTIFLVVALNTLTYVERLGILRKVVAQKIILIWITLILTILLLYIFSINSPSVLQTFYVFQSCLGVLTLIGLYKFGKEMLLSLSMVQPYTIVNTSMAIILTGVSMYLVSL
ncbi:hypothetical protein [Bacillus cytotoxicus]|uniref:hypothetical protein n=2 Tax=Bacillus cereus group TaxID=86661 RepID=UPI003D7CF1B6